MNVTKKVSLAVIGALTFAGFSSVSANAATYAQVDVSNAVSHTASTSTAGGTANAIGDGLHFVTVTITAGSADTAYVVSSTGVGQLWGSATASSGTITNTNGTNAASGFAWSKGSSISSASAFAGTETLTVTAYSAAAGNQTISINPVNSTSSALTEIITWGSAPVYSAGNSSSYYIESTTATAASTVASSPSTDATLPVARSAIGTVTEVGAIKVTLKDNQVSPQPLQGKTITAIVSGPALIAGQATAGASFGSPAGVATAITDSSGNAAFEILSGGLAGNSTVTLTYTDANGVLNTIATKSVVMYNTIPASFKVKQNLFVGLAGTALGVSSSNSNNTATVAGTPAIELSGFDSAGNIVGNLTSNGTFSAVSSNTNVLSNSIVVNEDNGSGTNSLGIGNYIVQPTFAANATSGSTATLTVTWTSSDGLTKISAAPVTFTVGGSTISTIVATGDKSSYNLGDKATLILTARDASGNPIADGNYKIFSAVNTAFVGFTTSAGVTTPIFGYGTVGSSYSTGTYVQFINGQASSSYYAPVYSGNFTATAVLTTDASVATALQGKTISYTTTIVNPQTFVADSATVAAKAASDSASQQANIAATTAAQALAAVTALQAQIKSLTAQLTTTLKAINSKPKTVVKAPVKAPVKTTVKTTTKKK